MSLLKFVLVFFAKLFEDAGYGVKLIGVTREPVKEVAVKMGIETDKVDRHKNETKIFEYVEGVEFKFTPKLSDINIDVSRLSLDKIENQLMDFLRFCNDYGIRIASDFAFFVKENSKVVVFDYDLYKIDGSDKAIKSNSFIILNRIEVVRSYLEGL